MTPDVVMALARDAIELTLAVAGPLLGVGLAAGVTISLVQAVTQIQEPSLQFVPKLLGVFAALGLGGPWMLAKLVTYTAALLSNLNTYAP